MIVCVTCPTCEIKEQCRKICDAVEMLLPSIETGRIDPEDLQRIIAGKTMTNLILDNESILAPRQQQVVRLYYRETLLETEIAKRLGISQQAVSNCLASVKEGLWQMIHKKMAVTRKININ